MDGHISKQIQPMEEMRSWDDVRNVSSSISNNFNQVAQLTQALEYFMCN